MKVKAKINLWISISIVIVILIFGFFVLYNGTVGEGQSCYLDDEGSSDCEGALLCNVGSGGYEGVCNTVQQCISSGSSAEAFEGSDICFMGV